eukprot:EG_transcript_22013
MSKASRTVGTSPRSTGLPSKDPKAHLWAVWQAGLRRWLAEDLPEARTPDVPADLRAWLQADLTYLLGRSMQDELQDTFARPEAAQRLQLARMRQVDAELQGERERPDAEGHTEASLISLKRRIAGVTESLRQEEAGHEELRARHAALLARLKSCEDAQLAHLRRLQEFAAGTELPAEEFRALRLMILGLI